MHLFKPIYRLWISNYARNLDVSLEFKSCHIRVRKSNHVILISPEHELYLKDMINFFDYYHGAVIPNIIKGVAVVDYSHPTLQKLTRSGIEFDFPSLPESDESTEAYMTALDVKLGEAVFDLGAYAGASAYFLAKAVGTEGIVISFEPDEINFRYLRANITRHNLTNVRPVQKGVWSESTSLEFQAEGNMGSSIAKILRRKSNVKVVQVVSLEDAAKLTGGKRVSAVKMDIEGAEVVVLRKAGEFLREHQPRLIIEPHVVEGKMATEEICHILQNYGYVTELLSQGTQNWPLIAARPVNV
jgi:FkbM family methyltransferase